MLCGNKYCIYWSRGECILKNISLDIQGICESCVLTDIDEQLLRKFRKTQLDRYEEISNDEK